MKVVHIAATKYGGAGRAAFRQHKALLEAGVSSFFLSLTDRSENVDVDAENLILANNFSYKLPYFMRLQRKLGLGNKIDRFWSDFNDLSNTLDAEVVSMPFGFINPLIQPGCADADIYNLHWLGSTIDWHRFFVRVKKPLVWTLHDKNPFSGLFHLTEDEIVNNSVVHALERRIIDEKKSVFKKNNYGIDIVTPSAWLANNAARSEVMQKLPVTVIPNSVDLSVFQPAKKKAFKEKIGISGFGLCMLYISHKVDARHKGWFELLNIMRTLNGRNANVHLIAIGERESVTDVPSNITLTGKIKNDDDLSAFYNAADWVLIPSREDNLPNVMLEALACGCPVLATPNGGMKEHIAGSSNGIISRTDDWVDIILNLRPVPESQSQAIRSYAESTFNPLHQANAYKNLYQKIFQK